jgi:hypothetical protein
LMLSWSNGGTLLSLLLEACPFPLATSDLTMSCFDQELLLSMPPCVPWPSFLCAYGCRRPKEERLRKLRFHSAEAREGRMFRDQAWWWKSEIPPCAIISRHAIWDAEPMNSAATLQPCFVWMYHLVCLCTLYNMIL